MIQKIENITKTFFQKLDIVLENIEVEKQKENVFLIKIKTPDSWIIIWNHWENLKNFENILKLLISRKLEEKINIHLEVNDYIYNKDQKLFNFIDSKIEIVLKTKKDFRLPFLTAYERKKVHSYVASLNNPQIFTKSKWEWKQRRLYLCAKDEKITIDLDWTDI